MFFWSSLMPNFGPKTTIRANFFIKYLAGQCIRIHRPFFSFFFFKFRVLSFEHFVAIIGHLIENLTRKASIRCLFRRRKVKNPCWKWIFNFDYCCELGFPNFSWCLIFFASFLFCCRLLTTENWIRYTKVPFSNSSDAPDARQAIEREKKTNRINWWGTLGMFSKFIFVRHTFWWRDFIEKIQYRRGRLRCRKVRRHFFSPSFLQVR